MFVFANKLIRGLGIGKIPKYLSTRQTHSASCNVRHGNLNFKDVRLLNYEVSSFLRPVMPSVSFTRFRSRSRKLEKPVDWLPFSWKWPPRFNVFEQSGDLVKTVDVDPSTPKLGFELSEELKTANEHVKKVFSVSTATLLQRVEVKKRLVLEQVQRHPLDFDSLEVKIALQTIRVRKMFEFWNLKKKWTRTKINLHTAIQKRNMMLKQLYRMDTQRFNWLIKVLQLEYKPQPMGVKKERFTKKWDLRRLTREYCANMKNQKRAAYHAELKAQQEAFLREKEETLAWIAKEEAELGVSHKD